ncbi:DNA dependent reverse transcriptase [Pseudoloma neurophilia]|uniref:DNA dependent reverse transcriptase n=1 Tax=Pseudoloma neurophilia TaxID=146866 RepID=A0A0R0M3A6_9MICR|nr:DNA dependent reverse transcriptase [Pseudoloma neurophilia]
MSEMIRSLHNEKFFSVLDLKDGYFQVSHKKEDRDKTAFLSPDNRILHFTRMPQDYKNSPATFQRRMTLMLSGLLGKIWFVI